MGWWNRLFAEPLEPTPSADELIKQAETTVRAYSHLVAESGTNLPESALPYSKELIRTSLLLWAALEDESDTRTRLCCLYGMLEDFLPHDEWKILHEWNRIIRTKDMGSLMNADSEFGRTAIRLLKETTERGAARMGEFKERLRQVDERRRVRAAESPDAPTPAPAAPYTGPC